MEKTAGKKPSGAKTREEKTLRAKINGEKTDLENTVHQTVDTVMIVDSQEKMQKLVEALY